MLLERNLAYVPLAAALRDALADVDFAAEPLPALRQILPELGLGTQKPAFDEIDVLEALVALIADHAPVVLLLDDLHLADHRTLAALGYLRRRAAVPRSDRDDGLADARGADSPTSPSGRRPASSAWSRSHATSLHSRDSGAARVNRR